MNVFVLSSGRCGSMTVSRAFAHATNYTSGHETRARGFRGRLEYPDNHIESDNRLSWFLGSLHTQYAQNAHWIHLTRDPEAVIESYYQRWTRNIDRRRLSSMVRRPRQTLGWFREWLTEPTSRLRGSITVAFAYGVVFPCEPLTDEERREACGLYVETINDNIAQFLSGRPNVSRIRLEEIRDGFEGAWHAIGATGDIDDALAELDVRYNAL